jgi:hypothetical protein
MMILLADSLARPKTFSGALVTCVVLVVACFVRRGLFANYWERRAFFWIVFLAVFFLAGSILVIQEAPRTFRAIVREIRNPRR